MISDDDFNKRMYTEELNKIENKKLMTRKEALQKLHNVPCCEDCQTLDDLFLTKLEALELIKFDEPKRKYVFFPNVSAGKDNVTVYLDDAISTLKLYGYTIYDSRTNKL